MIVTPIIYISLAILFWRLFRKPHRRSTRIGAVVLLLVGLLAIYRSAIFDTIEYRQWLAEQPSSLTPAALSSADTIALPHRSCTAPCLDLLAKRAVRAVITSSELLPYVSQKLMETTLPYVEWTLTSDAAYCRMPAAQQIMDHITGLYTYKSLLVQGYCVRATPVATLDGAYEIGVKNAKRISAGDSDAGRGVWTLIHHRDGSSKVMAEIPYYDFPRPAFPPLPYLHIYYAPTSFKFYQVTSSEGPTKLPAMLALSTGLIAIDIFDSSPYDVGPIWVDDYAPLVHAAARSDSIPLQRSAAALICRSRIEDRQRFRADVEVLARSKDLRVRNEASYCLRWVR
jgi:hypothetical protein